MGTAVAISERARVYLEGAGETAIRAQLERGDTYPNVTVSEANEWLEEVQLQRMELSNAPSLRIAKTAKDAAMVAAIAAVAAIPIAIIAIVIALLAWLSPR